MEICLDVSNMLQLKINSLLMVQSSPLSKLRHQAGKPTRLGGAGSSEHRNIRTSGTGLGIAYGELLLSGGGL